MRKMDFLVEDFGLYLEETEGDGRLVESTVCTINLGIVY